MPRWQLLRIKEVILVGKQFINVRWFVVKCLITLRELIQLYLVQERRRLHVISIETKRHAVKHCKILQEFRVLAILVKYMFVELLRYAYLVK